MTRADYEAATDKDEHGYVTSIIPFYFDTLLEKDYDSVVDMIAEQVISELGEQWAIGYIEPVGIDTPELFRERVASRVLLEVQLHPGYTEEEA